jgi:hypothetical protein
MYERIEQVRRVACARGAWLALTLVALGLAGAGCGSAPGSSGSSTAPSDASAAPTALPAPLRLPDGPIPGTPLDGQFVSEQGDPVDDVTAMARGGAPGFQFQVLLGRGPDSVPCFAVVAVERPSRELHCLEDWERPPLVARVVATKQGLGVAGIVAESVTRLSLAQQTGENTDLELVGAADFPWRAFTALTPQADMANALTAYGSGDEPLDRIDVAWAYSTGCSDTSECGAQPTTGNLEVRDPIALASGTTDEHALPIAFADPAVRRLAARGPYSIQPLRDWRSCLDDDIGAMITIVFRPAISFSGEIPVSTYPEPGDGHAYRAGRARVEAAGVTAVEIYVDVDAGKVVGIALDSFDPISLDDATPADVDLTVLEQPSPAGPRDDMSCYRDED